MKFQTKKQFSNIVKILKQKLSALTSQNQSNIKDVATKISIKMTIFGYFMCFVPFD